MVATPGDLFTHEWPADHRKLARREDPGTSKEAAHAIATKLAKAMKATLTALNRNAGCTASELETLEHVREGTHRKRLNDLRVRGMAHTEGTRKCRITGRAAQLWWPGKERAR